MRDHRTFDFTEAEWEALVEMAQAGRRAGAIEEAELNKTVATRALSKLQRGGR